MIDGSAPQTSLYDVEILVRDVPGDGFVAEVRLPDSSEPASCRLPALTPLLLDSNLRRILTPNQYGHLLYDWLLPEELQSALHFAEEIASDSVSLMTEGGSPGVRVRLSLDRRSPALIGLGWEALWSPGNDWPLSLRMAFSRFVPVRLPRSAPLVKAPLRMLLVVSNPPGLGRMDLAAIDQELMQNTTKRAFSNLNQWIEIERLSKPATLHNIAEFTRQPHDVLHVLAHTVLGGGQGRLVVAGEDGSATSVDWADVTRALIPEGMQAPRLVFLSTPVSIADNPDAVLLALGQPLIDAGVEAVVAVQGPMDGLVMRRFTERFYDVLLRTGVVDVAMTEARRFVFRAEGAEWTYPVLFSRTTDNRLFQPLSLASERRVASFASAWKT